MSTSLALGAGGEAGCRGRPSCLEWLLPPPVHQPARPPGALLLSDCWRHREGPCSPSGGGGPCLALPPALWGWAARGGGGVRPRLPPAPSEPCDHPRRVGTACHSFLCFSLVLLKLIRLGIYLQRLQWPR